MADYDDLLRWAENKGVELHGIRPEKLEGRGTGMVTTRRLKPEDPILIIPAGALRSVTTIPENILQRVSRQMPLHSLLAAELALDTSDELTPWRRLLPTRTDLSATIPFMWPKPLQELLPTPARKLLINQQAKFQRELDMVTSAFPELLKEDFLYFWFIINTRTFLYEIPETQAYAWEDRLALLPVADLFNHADTGCHVWYSPEGFTIAADREYEAGEEIFISYGHHSDDFLLTEYGFMIINNKWNRVLLDDEILPRLNDKQKLDLTRRGLLGSYELDSYKRASRRTHVVLRLLCCSYDHWLKYVDDQDDGSSSQEAADALLNQLLDEFSNDVCKFIYRIDQLNADVKGQKETLKSHWEQIQVMVGQMKRLGLAANDS